MKSPLGSPNAITAAGTRGKSFPALTVYSR